MADAFPPEPARPTVIALRHHVRRIRRHILTVLHRQHHVEEHRGLAIVAEYETPRADHFPDVESRYLETATNRAWFGSRHLLPLSRCAGRHLTRLRDILDRSRRLRRRLHQRLRVGLLRLLVLQGLHLLRAQQ